MHSSARRFVTAFTLGIAMLWLGAAAQAQTLPSITSFIPKFCPPGADVTITGTNFSNITAVSIAGVDVSYTVNSTTKITATAPGGGFSSVVGPIKVSIPGYTTTSSQSFTVWNQTQDHCLELGANIRSNPYRIELFWPADSAHTNYTIARKDPGSSTFSNTTTFDSSSQVATPSDYHKYTDANVTLGSVYEYRVSSGAATGYIRTGINVPLTENRGKIVLICDNTYTLQLTNELDRLERDLIGDGWQVLRHNVARTDIPPTVKAVIKADYDADPSNVKAVLLFGHVAVPYSGSIAPDGHTPETGGSHVGAWPADMYYADMDGTWTDTTVTSLTGQDERQHNVPGDGKFDQSSSPTPLELQVGRVDLSNLPQAPKNELELLRQYLNKDHNWRNKYTTVQTRAIVDDNFPIDPFAEAFAASGWQSFAPSVGVPNLIAGEIFPGTTTGSYLFAYGCGGGSFTGASGVGISTQFYNNNPQAVFTMLFGSYFGDWDNSNNFLRSPLASTTYGLTCAWAGRPYWQLFHMGLGETIGYSTLATQNEFGGRSVHVALMGDPTLRLHQLSPVSNVAVTVKSTGTSITWTASPDAGVGGFRGYYIYRSGDARGPYTRLNASPVTGTAYTDSSITTSNYQYAAYMVRAVKLESVNSGNYFNASTGIIQDNSTKPTVAITKPANNQFINGMSAITGNADDGFKAGNISRVELRLKRLADANGTSSYWNGFQWVVPADSSPISIPVLDTSYDRFGRVWSRNYNLPSGTNLISGNYALTATAIDVRNGTNSASINFVVDVVAPTVKYTAPVAWTSSSTPATITVPDLSNFAGTIEDNLSQNPLQPMPPVGPNKVTLAIRRQADNRYWDGTTWSNVPTVTVDTNLSGNNWSNKSNLPTGSDVVPGGYVVTARGYDKLGNNSSLSLTVFVDNIAPTLSFTRPTNGTYVNNLNPVTGNVSDNTNGSGVGKVDLVISRINSSAGTPQYGNPEYWTGSTWVPQRTSLSTTLQVFAGSSTTVWTYTNGALNTPFLIAGVYTLEATGYDKSGNSTVQTIQVTVDVSPPLVNINSPSDGSSISSLTTVSGSAVDNSGGSGNAYVQLLLRRQSDGQYWTGSFWGPNPQQLPTTLQSDGNWSKTGGFPSGAYLPAGSYMLAATAYDQAGNSRVTTNYVTVVSSGGSSSSSSSTSAPVDAGGSTASSNVTLSSATVSAATRQVWLYFTGALDAGSVTVPANYTVLVNGQAVPVTGAAYGSVSRCALLTLGSSFVAGSKVDIAWSGLRDTKGLAVTGKIGPLTAR